MNKINRRNLLAIMCTLFVPRTLNRSNINAISNSTNLHIFKKKPYFNFKLPAIFAHRGASGFFPENTVLAFEKAIEYGADVIETDVRMTSDNVLVLHHDAELLRTAGVEKRVDELSYKELQKIDIALNFTLDGGKTFPFRGKGLVIPTVEEILVKFTNTRINLEIKDRSKSIAKKLLGLIKDHNAINRILVASKYFEPLDYVRGTVPEIATSACQIEVLFFLLQSSIDTKRIEGFSFNALQVPEKKLSIKIVNKNFLKMAKLNEIQVHVWTLNEEKDIRRILDLGVDAVMTDYPEIAFEIARSYRH